MPALLLRVLGTVLKTFHPRNRSLLIPIGTNAASGLGLWLGFQDNNLVTEGGVGGDPPTKGIDTQVVGFN